MISQFEQNTIIYVREFQIFQEFWEKQEIWKQAQIHMYLFLHTLNS